MFQSTKGFSSLGNANQIILHKRGHLVDLCFVCGLLHWYCLLRLRLTHLQELSAFHLATVRNMWTVYKSQLCCLICVPWWWWWWWFLCGLKHVWTWYILVFQCLHGMWMSLADGILDLLFSSIFRSSETILIILNNIGTMYELCVL
jgi:hypothetical protein